MWVIIPKNLRQSLASTVEVVDWILESPSELADQLARSVTLKETLRQSQYWKIQCDKGGWTKHLCSLIPTPSTANHFITKWIGSLEDSHANPLASLDKCEQTKTKGGSGTTSGELFARYDQETSSWKTFQASLFTKELDEYSATFPPSGSMQNGQLSKRPTSVRHTNAKGSLSSHTKKGLDQVWLTPIGSDGEGGLKSMRNDPLKPKLRDHSVEQVRQLEEDRLWTTPTHTENDNPQNKASKIHKGKIMRSSGARVQMTLSDKVMLEELRQNPGLADLTDEPIISRPNLPSHKDFTTWLRSTTTVAELSNQTELPKTTVEHWFRKEKDYFSYPTLTQWEIIKSALETLTKEVKFDKEMTTTEEKEWVNPNEWRTPNASSQFRLGGETQGSKGLEPLSRKVMDNMMTWATPSTMNNMNFPETNMEKRNSLSLGTQASLMGTPNQEKDTKGETSEMSVANQHSHQDQAKSSPGTESLKNDQTSLQRWRNLRLNPKFVEWLMGWQISSTELIDLESSETELYLYNLLRRCAYWSQEYGASNE